MRNELFAGNGFAVLWEHRKLRHGCETKVLCVSANCPMLTVRTFARALFHKPNPTIVAAIRIISTIVQIH